MDPTIPPQPVAPISTKQKNPLLTIIVIIILFLSLGAVGFLMYQNQQLKQQIAILTKPIPSPIPTTIPDEADNWKTYNNNKYNFSFKYPSQWIVEEVNDKFLYLNNKKIDNSVTQTNQVFFTLSINTEKEEATWLRNRLNEVSNSNIETINNIKYIITDLRSHSIGGYSFIHAETVDKNDVVYRFGLSDENYERYFAKILSTFKFTN